MAPIPTVLLRRLALGALTLLIVSAMIFLAVDLLPGDIATETLGQSATDEIDGDEVVIVAEYDPFG